MAIEWKKQRERQNASINIMDRFVDGKILGDWEMMERNELNRHMGIIFGSKAKRNNKNPL